MCQPEFGTFLPRATTDGVTLRRIIFLMTRRWRRFAALIVIAALALSQAALAAYACPRAAQMAPAQEMSMSAPCEQGEVAVDPLCESHCKDEKQKPTDAGQIGLAAPFMPKFWSRVDTSSPDPTSSIRSPSLLQARPPPLSIRNCCFRI